MRLLRRFHVERACLGDAGWRASKQSAVSPSLTRSVRQGNSSKSLPRSWLAAGRSRLGDAVPLEVLDLFCFAQLRTGEAREWFVSRQGTI